MGVLGSDRRFGQLDCRQALGLSVNTKKRGQLSLSFLLGRFSPGRLWPNFRSNRPLLGHFLLRSDPNRKSELTLAVQNRVVVVDGIGLKCYNVTRNTVQNWAPREMRNLSPFPKQTIRFSKISINDQTYDYLNLSPKITT